MSELSSYEKHSQFERNHWEEAIIQLRHAKILPYQHEPQVHNLMILKATGNLRMVGSLERELQQEFYYETSKNKSGYLWLDVSLG